MAVEVSAFIPELLPAVEAFSRKVFDRPVDPQFHRWRCLDAPDVVGLLALRDGECLAMLWGFLRSYRVNDGARVCVETFDWHCLPEWRGSGIGVRLMQALMARPEPILAVGGSDDTLGLLPRLKWRLVGGADVFALPLGSGFLSERLHARFRHVPRPFIDMVAHAAGVWLRPQAWHRPRQAAVHRSEPDGAAMLALNTAVPSAKARWIPEPSFVDWMQSGSRWTGHYLPLSFTVAGRAVGWSLSRIWDSRRGREAALLDVVCTDERWYRWLVSETAVQLAAHRPFVLHCLTSRPALQHALRQNRFLRTGALPVYFWARPPIELFPLEVSGLSSDHAFSSVQSIEERGNDDQR